MLVRFAKGAEFGKDSKVFLPITTILPSVNLRKRARSSGIENSMSPSKPMAKLMSVAKMSFKIHTFLFMLYLLYIFCKKFKVLPVKLTLVW